MIPSDFVHSDCEIDEDEIEKKGKASIFENLKEGFLSTQIKR